MINVGVACVKATMMMMMMENVKIKVRRVFMFLCFA